MNNQILRIRGDLFLGRTVLALIVVLILAACSRGPTQESGSQSPDLATTAPLVIATSPAPTRVGTGDGPAAIPGTATQPEPAATQAESSLPDTSSQAEFPPPPVCTGELPLTPPNSEGPYYTPDTPERTSLLEPEMPGTRLIVTGYVVTPDCQPVAGAMLDFWQADANGEYDNNGYRLRGHQFTDEEGRYFLETILPEEYPGRPPHIHVKVQPPGQPVFTTQLYFPEAESNERDGIFLPELVVSLEETLEGLRAYFNFVVEDGS